MSGTEVSARIREQQRAVTYLHDDLQVRARFTVFMKDGHRPTDTRNATFQTGGKTSTYGRKTRMKARTTGRLRCSSECTARHEPTTNVRILRETSNLLEGRVITFRRVSRLVPVHEDGHPILGVPYASELHVNRTARTLLHI